MAKRKSFYVNTAIFDSARSVHAVAVYAYLSFCADKSGTCFPSMNTIARHCGISQNTARKALCELADSGLVRSETSHRISKSGRRLQCANRYTLASYAGSARSGNTIPSPAAEAPVHVPDPTPSTIEPAPVRKMNPFPSPAAGEINDNSKTITADVPSVAVSLYETNDTKDLDAILDRLQLHLFEDRAFAEAVEQTLMRMYFAPYWRMDGERVEQSLVRKRLQMLSIDHIDYVEKQIDTRGGEITSADRYLAACLYHAPVDCLLKTARDLNA